MKKGKSLQRALSVVIAGVLLSGILGSNFVAQALDETNLALGKTVALTIGGGGTDNDPQGVTHEGGSVYTIAEVEQESVNRLTDGVKLADSGAEFEENWVNGKWNELSGTRSKYVQFYRNMNRELDLDLGQISNVTSLSMSFGACSAYGISAPVSVSYYISEDGENYYLAGKVLSADTVAEETACTGDTPMAHSYYELTGLNYNIRYVKICFDVNVWLFTDEIEIVGTIEESAEADPLPTTPYLPELVVNAYATEELSGGIKNEELAYAGWYKSGSELKTSVKTETELLHTIAYVDEEGTPTDWLFNSITFLNHGYDDQGRYTVYHNDVNSASQYTDKAGWESYLDHIFDYSDATDNSYNLGALDAAVADARETLNDPDYAVGVKIQIMPPVHVQSDWGQLVDGEGDSLDFTVEGAGSEEAALANRLAAVSWYINEVISRFEEKSYQNITLDGFYYFDEVIRLSDDTIAAQTIQGITRAVHDNSMKIYWIPYYQAEGFSKWSSFGFDYAIMQPNYAFYNDASVTRIADCAALAKKYGLGIEMELGSLVDDENQRLTKFKEYLIQGADDDLGYQNQSLIGWYTGTWDLYNASINTSNARYIYDAIYRFLQGDPVAFEEDEETESVTAGKPVSITYEGSLLSAYAETYQTNIANIAVLTNDTYGTDDAAGYLRLNANYFDQKNVVYSVTATLQGKYDLDSLSMSFYQRTGWGIDTPASVTFYTSNDGETWTEAGTALKDNAESTVITATGSASYRLDYTLVPSEAISARYVRAVFTHSTTWLYVDEVKATGTAAEAGNPVYSALPAGKKINAALSSISYLGTLAETDTAQTAWTNVLASTDRLTNGTYGAGCSYATDYLVLNRNQLGLTAAPYEFVFELGSLYSLDGLSLTILEKTSWGINVPDCVAFWTSQNGTDWTEAGAVDRYEAQVYNIETSGGTRYHYVLPLGGNTVARYVKIVFTHSSEYSATFLYVDEFEASGSLYTPQQQTDDSKDNEDAAEEEKDTTVPVTEGDTTKYTIKPDNYGSDTSNKAVVRKSDLNKAIAQALTAAENSKTRAVVEIQVPSTNHTRQAQASVPVASLEKIVKSGVSEMVVSSGIASIAFDADALSAIAGQVSEESVRIVAGKIDITSLPQDVRDSIGDAEVFEFSILAGTTAVSSFGAGKAAVTIPYTLKEGESADGITVWYIGSDGTLQKVENAKYDADKKTVTFETTHFSTYAVSYVSLSAGSEASSEKPGSQIEQIPETGGSNAGKAMLPMLLFFVTGFVLMVISNFKQNIKN